MEKISNKLSQEEKKLVFGYLGKFRYFSDELYSYPEKVVGDLMNSQSDSQHVYFPCDVIELRWVLENNKFLANQKRYYFSFKFAKKYFVDYPILLSIKKDFDTESIGGLYVDRRDIPIISDKIDVIYVREKSFGNLSKVIEEISCDLGLYIPINTLNDLPAFSEKKIAFANEEKYVINIDALDIVNEIASSKSRYDAVKRVLDKKWFEIKRKTGLTYRPAKYKVEFWLKSPFWSDIVKEASLTFNISKKASNGGDLQLNNKENAIFNFLKEVKGSYTELQGVEMRVAGGWVRDKLLGLPNDDIDIALSNITGAKFIYFVKDYVSKKQNETNIVGKTYIVDQNIEKSKHLETAAVEIYGEKIEFVNLRSETYGDTRIPEIIAGTPEQDAKRRDLTINAMFYNLDTGKIEDYVGGLQDLQSMILRTPTIDDKKSPVENAVEIFTQDPLRMLRVLRFYSRYPNSKIDPSILEAMKNTRVHEIYKKLSPERSSSEFIKMMQGAKPVEAVRILFETGLYKIVLGVPEDIHDINLNQENPHHRLTIMNHTLEVIRNLNQIALEQNMSKEERGMLNLAAMLHDIGKLYKDIRRPHPKKPGVYQYIGHEKRSGEFANELLTRMAFPEDAKKFISTVISQHMKPHNLLPNEKGEINKKHMGKFLNEVDDLYDKIVYHGMADTLSKGFDTPETLQQIRTERQNQLDIIRKYREDMGTRINKSLVDGFKVKEIVDLFAPELSSNNAFISNRKFSKPLYYIKFIINNLMEQQWSGNVTTSEQAEEYIKKNIKNWLNLWRQQQTQQTQQTKKADASSDQGPEGFQGSPEGFDKTERDGGIKFMPYYALIPFAVGDKVKLRVGGLSNEPIMGRVTGIKNNKMLVEWMNGKYKGKQLVYDLNDTVKLTAALEKIQ